MMDPKYIDEMEDINKNKVYETKTEMRWDLDAGAAKDTRMTTEYSETCAYTIPMAVIN